MPDNEDRDEQALLLCEEGRAFAGIARVLELANAVEANAAFNRALRRHTPGYQVTLRSREMRRLDTLDTRPCPRPDRRGRPSSARRKEPPWSPSPRQLVSCLV